MSKFFKALVIACVLALGAKSPAAENNAASRFDAANKFYEQGKYAESAAAYEAVVQQGKTSFPLLFNLGNARFKAGEMGRAIAGYRRAQNFSPRDADLAANLQFARAQVQGPTIRARLWQRVLSQLTVNEWTVLAATAMWLAFALLIAGKIRPPLAARLRRYTQLTVFCTAFFGACAFAAVNEAAVRMAIVARADVTVRNGPFDESPNAFAAHDGAELRVLDEKDAWLQVTDDAGRTGWLKSADAVTLPR